MEFKFTVRGDKITADKNYKFVEGNKGVYEAVFSFDEEWNEELSKVCICVVDGERYAADIKGDRCVLPVFKRGSVYVGVVGTAYDEIDPITFATTLSTNMLFLGVQPGAASEETIAEFENAAELWEKYLYDTCTARNAAEAAKETAVNAAARAEDANAFANAAKEATEKAETNAENAAEKAENAR